MVKEVVNFIRKNKLKVLFAVGTAFSPVAIPVVTYNYYLGYFDYFGISKYFISLGQTETIEALVFITLFLVLSTLFYLPIIYILKAIVDFTIMNPLRKLIRHFVGSSVNVFFQKVKKKFKEQFDFGFVFLTIFYLLYLFLVVQSFPQVVGKYVAKGQTSFSLSTDNTDKYLVIIKQNDLMIISRYDPTDNSISKNYSITRLDKEGLLYSQIEIKNLKLKQP